MKNLIDFWVKTIGVVLTTAIVSGAAMLIRHETAIGVAKAQADGVTKTVDEQKSDIKEIRKSVEEIKNILIERR